VRGFRSSGSSTRAAPARRRRSAPPDGLPCLLLFLFPLLDVTERIGEVKPQLVRVLGEAPAAALIAGGRYSGRLDHARDAWRHPAAVGSAARPTFPWWRRGAREKTGEREKRGR
jgi:hypothetical protein